MKELELQRFYGEQWLSLSDLFQVDTLIASSTFRSKSIPVAATTSSTMIQASTLEEHQGNYDDVGNNYHFQIRTLKLINISHLTKLYDTSNKLYQSLFFSIGQYLTHLSFDSPSTTSTSLLSIDLSKQQRLKRFTFTLSQLQFENTDLNDHPHAKYMMIKDAGYESDMRLIYSNDNKILSSVPLATLVS